MRSSSRSPYSRNVARPPRRPGCPRRRRARDDCGRDFPWHGNLLEAESRSGYPNTEAKSNSSRIATAREVLMRVIATPPRRLFKAIALTFGATVLFAGVPLAASAQELPQAGAEEVGLSSPRLNRLTRFPCAQGSGSQSTSRLGRRFLVVGRPRHVFLGGSQRKADGDADGSERV
jgi:hypothetical protein